MPEVPESDAPVAGASSQISRKRKRDDEEFQDSSKRVRSVTTVPPKALGRGATINASLE